MTFEGLRDASSGRSWEGRTRGGGRYSFIRLWLIGCARMDGRSRPKMRGEGMYILLVTRRKIYPKLSRRMRIKTEVDHFMTEFNNS